VAKLLAARLHNRHRAPYGGPGLYRRPEHEVDEHARLLRERVGAVVREATHRENGQQPDQFVLESSECQRHAVEM